MKKGLTRDGQIVDIGEPGVVVQIDTDEPGHEKTVEVMRKQWLRDNPAAATPPATEAQPLEGPVETTTGEGGDPELPTAARLIVNEFGARIGNALIEAGFADAPSLQAASDAELLSVAGVGPGTLTRIREYAAPRPIVTPPLPENGLPENGEAAEGEQGNQDEE